MSNDSYTKEFVVDASPKMVFEAIMSGVDKWWTTSSNKTEKEGDQLTARFGDDGHLYMVMNLTKVVQNKVIHWSVVDDCIDVNGKLVKGEWVGTTIKWNLQEENGGTKVSFIHEGLKPSLVCYGVCDSAWDYFLDSLAAYLNTGKGSPSS